MELQQIGVKIGVFPGGKIKPYDFPFGTTYKEAISQKVRLEEGDKPDVRLGGKPLSNMDAPMNDGDLVLVYTKVRGN